MKIENTQADYPDVASINMLVYGMGGVGKTTFASTFPKPLLVDFENGAKYFKQRGIDIDVVRMNSWFSNDDKKELAKMMENYETIVLDPIGEMMEKLIHSDQISGTKYRQSDGSLTIAGWGKVKDSARSLLKWSRDLGKHVVLVAHVDEKTDEESLVKRPLIATRLDDEIIAMVDIVGYLDIINADGLEKRVLRVNPADKKYIAKDRTGALDNYVKPEFDYIHGQITKNQTKTKKAPKTASTPQKSAKKTTSKPKESKDNPFDKKNDGKTKKS